ncbi:MAG: HAMP domain-containing protein, partial [Stellaceae bacterium]
MSFFSIRGRLVFLSVILLAILAVTSARLTHELQIDSQSLADEAQLVSTVRTANEASKHFGDLKYWLTEFAMTLLNRSQQNANAAKVLLQKDLRAIAPIDAKGVAAIEREIEAMTAIAQKASEAFTSDDSAAGSALMSQAQSHILNVDRELNQIVDRVEQQAVARRDASMHDARRAVRRSLIIVAIALAIALVLTTLIVRSINAPLRRLQRSMQAITQGRLDVPIPRPGRDEVGAMARALVLLRDSLMERNRLEQERRRADTQLQRAQEQLSEAIEAISEGFALFDAEDRLVVSNRRYRELHAGLDLDLTEGTSFEDIVTAAAEGGTIPIPGGDTGQWIA